MNTQILQEVTRWFHSTDLTELVYKRAGKGISLSSLASSPAPVFSACSLVPVLSQAVGLFRWNKVGAPRSAEKGREVSQGQVLGVVEAGPENVEVKSPVSGLLVSITVEEGKAVEYGQALFFIQPH